MSLPILHLVGKYLAPELAEFARELQRRAVVYCFKSTDELLDGWRLARRTDAAAMISPAAVVWLQSRSGEFAQREIDAVQTLDPLARSIVVAGCWSEGEPRSGRLLAGVTRVYWHQGRPALTPVIAPDSEQQKLPAEWIAIHTAQFLDYQGLASVCQSLGLRTIWQSDRGPAISSEPAVRLFAGWQSWEAWQEQRGAFSNVTPGILFLNFPRPADELRAQREHLVRVVAQPFSAAEIRQTFAALLATPSNIRWPRKAHTPQIQHNRTTAARRRSA